jgi:hypothetical protein
MTTDTHNIQHTCLSYEYSMMLCINRGTRNKIKGVMRDANHPTPKIQIQIQLLSLDLRIRILILLFVLYLAY